MNNQFVLNDAKYEEGKILAIYVEELSTGAKDESNNIVYESDYQSDREKISFYAHKIIINDGEQIIQGGHILNDTSKIDEDDIINVENKIQEKLINNPYDIKNEISRKYGGLQKDLPYEANISLNIQLRDEDEWKIVFYRQ